MTPPPPHFKHISVLYWHSQMVAAQALGLCKIYGLYRADANGHGARTFSVHINNGRGTFFKKHIHFRTNTFLFIFLNYFLH